MILEPGGIQITLEHTVFRDTKVSRGSVRKSPTQSSSAWDEQETELREREPRYRCRRPGGSIDQEMEFSAAGLLPRLRAEAPKDSLQLKNL